MTQVHEKERELQREVADAVQGRLPAVDVLAVELSGPEHLTVYIDHPEGVDHALCASVTEALGEYLDRYRVDVSSPGLERPLRTQAHFAGAVGRRVALRTDVEIDGRKRFRGTLLGTEGDAVRLLREDAPAGEQQEFLLPIEDMAEAKLVLTDALIAEALKRGKAAERELQEASDEAVLDEAVEDTQANRSKKFTRPREKNRRSASARGD